MIVRRERNEEQLQLSVCLMFGVWLCYSGRLLDANKHQRHVEHCKENYLP